MHGDLEAILDRAIHGEFKDSIEWNQPYILSWLYAYALAKYSYLRESKLLSELYDKMKNTTLSILNDEFRFKNAIYEHYSAAGILFSLYHMAGREKNLSREYYNKALKALEELKWHEFDGEILAFSYMLARRANNEELTNKIYEIIINKMDDWVKSRDYEDLKNIIYVLFGFAYILDERLIDLISKIFELYNLSLLREIEDSDDPELIALTSYVLGRIIYNEEIKGNATKKLGKDMIKTIEYDFIQDLGNALISSFEREFSSDIGSISRDLLVKIELALIETGFDKPYGLSKYEWEIYHEVMKSHKNGFYSVYKPHLRLVLILDTIPTPLMVFILLKYPQYGIIIKFILSFFLTSLAVINFILYKYGRIKRRHIKDLLEALIKGILKWI